MSKSQEFSFADNSVALGYDNELVPVLFLPWAQDLVSEFGPWEGTRVLDLATGTGIVAQELAKQMKSGGSVLGTDLNGQMLEIARDRCRSYGSVVDFVESPAAPLEVESGSIDTVVCQQGFQFFPEKPEAAREIARVLKPGGRVIATTWRPLGECEYFGTIRDSLTALGEGDISELIRIPFDFMPEGELESAFQERRFPRSPDRAPREEHDSRGRRRPGRGDGVRNAHRTQVARASRRASAGDPQGIRRASARGLRRLDEHGKDGLESTDCEEAELTAEGIRSRPSRFANEEKRPSSRPGRPRPTPRALSLPSRRGSALRARRRCGRRSRTRNGRSRDRREPRTPVPASKRGAPFPWASRYRPLPPRHRERGVVHPRRGPPGRARMRDCLRRTSSRRWHPPCADARGSARNGEWPPPGCPRTRSTKATWRSYSPRKKSLEPASLVDHQRLLE